MKPLINRYWHCWLYKTDTTPSQFIYGYAAPSHIKTTSALPHCRKFSEGIIEHYLPLNLTRIQALLCGIKKDILDFERINVGLNSQRIKYKQTTVENALGTSAVQIKTYYTFAVPDIDFTPQQVKLLFNHLHTDAPYSEPEKFMHRIGCFDIIQLPAHSEDESPIVTLCLINKQAKKHTPTKRNQFQIKRRTDIAQHSHTAHIRLFCGNSLLSDSLYNLPAGQEASGIISSNDEFDKCQFWLFDNNSKLIHQDEAVWLNTISTGIAMGGAVISYEDSLVAKLMTSGNHDKANQLATVQVRSKETRSEIRISTLHEIRDYQNEMYERGKTLSNKFSDDRWYPKGLLGSADALPHLLQIIEHQQIKQAWIVDPFFDAKAFEAIVPRIGRRDIHLTVITNLNKIDPETGKGITTNSSSPKDKLKHALNTHSHLVHCHLKVLNLLRSPTSSKQAFHDRYLCLKHSKTSYTVYLLSNSMNSLMGFNYPFCISKMSGHAAESIAQYIMQLTTKTNPTSGQKLYCDLEWDNRAQ